LKDIAKENMIEETVRPMKESNFLIDTIEENKKGYTKKDNLRMLLDVRKNNTMFLDVQQLKISRIFYAKIVLGTAQ
jgi:hypothetical protein